MIDDLAAVTPDAVFEGGDLDCGSGLVLLIREAMADVPEGGVLELRSREPSVRDDLPPWCRMVGHALLGELPEPRGARYLIRKGAGETARAEADALAQDRERAREYTWRARARHAGHLRSTVYCRNFVIEVGQPASFEERDALPSAVEHLLAALAGDLVVGLGSACARAGLEVDDVELTARLTLEDVLAHLGLSGGSPAIERIAVKCYVTTMEDPGTVRAVWDEAVARAPVAATLARACELTLTLAIV